MRLHASKTAQQLSTACTGVARHARGGVGVCARGRRCCSRLFVLACFRFVTYSWWMVVGATMEVSRGSNCCCFVQVRVVVLFCFSFPAQLCLAFEFRCFDLSDTRCLAWIDALVLCSSCFHVRSSGGATLRAHPRRLTPDGKYCLGVESDSILSLQVSQDCQESCFGATFR